LRVPWPVMAARGKALLATPLATMGGLRPDSRASKSR
jgi:hypothetical protein